MTIGESMRKARERAGFSKSELAKKAGYNWINIWRIENGVTVPSIMTVVDLADALEISVDEYVGHSLRGENHA